MWWDWWDSYWSRMGDLVPVWGLQVPFWLILIAIIIGSFLALAAAFIAYLFACEFWDPPPTTKLPLGGGSLGDVYRAYCHDEWRAVKVLSIKGDSAHQKRREALFRREVELLTALNGRGTLPSLHHGITTNKRGRLRGRPYFYMECIEGDTLRERVEVKGALTDPQEIAELMVSISSGLAELHGVDIVHRDINPVNIMLSPRGPRLIDLGIGKQLGTNATETALAAGTLPFLSPEMAEKAETRTENDVYGWGVTMAYAITGVTVIPEWGDDRERGMAIALGRFTPEFVAALDAEAEKGPWHRSLVALIRNCMSIPPGDRPKDGWDVSVAARALQSALPKDAGSPLGHTDESLERALVRSMYRTMGESVFSGATWVREGSSVEERVAEAVQRLRRLYPTSNALKRGVSAAVLHNYFIAEGSRQGDEMTSDRSREFRSPLTWEAALRPAGVDVAITKDGLLVFS